MNPTTINAAAQIFLLAAELYNRLRENHAGAPTVEELLAKGDADFTAVITTAEGEISK